MKKFFAGIFFLAIFSSCSKENVVVKEVESTVLAVFKDQNIHVTNVQLQKQADGQISFKFNTQYEKNIVKVEMYHGATKSYLCTFSKFDVDGESASVKKYSVLDAQPMSTNTNYYMIKYITRTGDFSYSPLYTVH